jgi:hypothetical protein
LLVDAYKLSPELLFYDYQTLVEKYEFDAPPRDLNGAILRWLFMLPCPPSVYDFAPQLDMFVGDEEVLTIFSYDAGNLLMETKSRTLPYKGYTLYPNMDRDEFSCATRLLRILGVQDPPLERQEDVNKKGMRFEPLRRCLNLSWNKTFNYDWSCRDIHAHTDVNGTCAELEGAIDRQMNNRLIASRDINLIVMCFADHIAFAVKTEILERIEVLLHSSELQGRPSYDELDVYPEVTGRAGGKVFIRPKTLAALGPPQGVARALLRRTLENANRVDWQQVFVVNLQLLQYLDKVGNDLIWYLLQDNKLWGYNTVDLAKYFKNLHAAIRVTHIIPGYLYRFTKSVRARDWARRLYGLDTIVGRSELMSLDFTGELIMRAADPVIRKLPTIKRTPQGYGYIDFTTGYEDRLEHTCMKMARSLLKDNVHLNKFSEYFGSRMFWGASGGAPGATVTWDDSGEKLRVNKRGALLAVKEKELRFLMEKARSLANTPVVQWSVKALKYESGKLRAILNTILEHYIIQGYISNMVDSNARQDGWYSAAHNNPARIANAMRRLKDLNDRSGFMWDYADFNINHTFVLMAQQCLARTQVLIERGTSKLFEPSDKAKILDDMRLATAYVIIARFNTFVADNDSKIVLKTVRGLQSGERDTSRTNSDSNYIDTEIMKYTAKEMLGTQLVHNTSDHTGDDAFETLQRCSDGPLATALYNLTGAAGQAYKINLTYNHDGGASGEFLRLSYDSASRHVHGYPIRAMVGFVHGEFFQDPIPQPFERYAAFEAQRQKLARRGWSCPESLFRSVVATNCRLTFTDAKTKVKRHFVPDPALVSLPAAFGGVGVSETEYGLHSYGTGVKILNDNLTFRAILIPSGEGKTTLAQALPSMFVDHDMIVSIPRVHQLKQIALDSGDWRQLNKYLATTSKLWLHQERAEAVKEGRAMRTLLSWGVDTVDSSFKCIGLVLKQQTGLRANKANRLALINSKVQVKTFGTYAERNAYAMLHQPAPSHDGHFLVEFKRYETGGKQMPTFELPRVAVKDMLKRTKTKIVDFETIASYGLTVPDYLRHDILKSALSGAWPKQLLYEQLADYARRLYSWSKDGKWETSRMYVDISKYMPSLRHHIENRTLYHLGITGTTNTGLPRFELNDLGYPKARRIEHHYNGLPSLTRAFNLSVNTSMSVLLEGQVGNSDLERLNNLINSQLRRSGNRNSTPPPVLRDYATWLKLRSSIKIGRRQEVDQALFDWVSGKWSLIPPLASFWSADVVTFIRDLTIRYLEDEEGSSFFNALCQMSAVERSVYFHILERVVTRYVTDTLQLHYPGVILGD